MFYAEFRVVRLINLRKRNVGFYATAPWRAQTVVPLHGPYAFNAGALTMVAAGAPTLTAARDSPTAAARGIGEAGEYEDTGTRPEISEN
jgi:hypothetical protein